MTGTALTPEALRARIARLDSAATAVQDRDDLAELMAANPTPAAVLVPLVLGPAPGVLLTKRTAHLSRHSGQVSFPGGRIDAEDASPEAAALREAREEVGLDPALVRVLGSLPAHETVTGYTVVPILAHVAAPFIPRPEAGEVEEVFRVPLAHLADPGNFRVERRMWRGDWRRYYAVPYGPYYIWGATARMLRGLAERLV